MRPLNAFESTELPPLRVNQPATDETGILEYYREIDGGDLNAVLRRFDERAVYRRGNRPPYEGIGRIEYFFRQDRNLRGRHLLTEVSRYPESDLNVVIVKGFFMGTREGGETDAVEIVFKDLWVLNSRGKVEYRRSWITQD